MTDGTTAGLAAVMGVALIEALKITFVAVKGRRNGKQNAPTYDPDLCRVHGEDIAAAKASMAGLSDLTRMGFESIGQRLKSIEDNLNLKSIGESFRRR